MSNDMKMYNGYVDDDHLYIDEQPAAAGNKGGIFPDVPFLRQTDAPRRGLRQSRNGERGGNVTLRLLRGAAVSRRNGKDRAAQGKHRPPSPTP